MKSCKTGRIVSVNLLTSDDSILNHLLVMADSKCLLVSGNDGAIHVVDVEYGKEVRRCSDGLNWAVNCTALHSNQRIFCSVGDSFEAVIGDLRSCRAISPEEGSTGGHHVVTGGQDKSCRIYDMRRCDQPLRVFKTHMSSVRSLGYSPDGAFLTIGEHDDFVTLIDVPGEHGGEYKYCQTIDFFGSVAGFGWSADSSSLMIGIAGMDTGGLLNFERPVTCLDG